MTDKHIKVKGIEYKIVDESWEDRAHEVYHPTYTVYRRAGTKWTKLYSRDTHSSAEGAIPGLYAQKRCPTCGHSHTVRTIPF